jgi:general secretion pathway protein K
MVLVIAAIGVLALATAVFAKVTQGQVRASAIAVETSRAKALAATGINLAVLKLLEFRGNPTGKQRDFAIAGQPFGCRLGHDLLVTAALDEGGKIDLNFANERLLRALLLGLNLQPGRADALVDAILDFRDGDTVKRPKGAEEAEYRAAGRAGPKNAPFAATEELNQVLGIDAELAAQLAPFITAHSGKDGIDPIAAPRQLIEALRRGDQPAPPSDKSLDFTFAERTSDLPPHFAAASTRSIFSVRSEVVMGGGLRFALEAIVDLSAVRPRGGAQQQTPVYHLWRWRQVPSQLAAERLNGEGQLPQCELLAAAKAVLRLKLLGTSKPVDAHPGLGGGGPVEGRNRMVHLVPAEHPEGLLHSRACLQAARIETPG